MTGVFASQCTKEDNSQIWKNLFCSSYFFIPQEAVCEHLQFSFPLTRGKCLSCTFHHTHCKFNNKIYEVRVCWNVSNAQTYLPQFLNCLSPCYFNLYRPNHAQCTEWFKDRHIITWQKMHFLSRIPLLTVIEKKWILLKVGKILMPIEYGREETSKT